MRTGIAEGFFKATVTRQFPESEKILDHLPSGRFGVGSYLPYCVFVCGSLRLHRVSASETRKYLLHCCQTPVTVCSNDAPQWQRIFHPHPSSLPLTLRFPFIVFPPLFSNFALSYCRFHVLLSMFCRLRFFFTSVS